MDGIKSLTVLDMTTSTKLFCGVLPLLLFFRSSALKLDVQARFERLEHRMRQLQSMEGRIEKIETSLGGHLYKL